MEAAASIDRSGLSSPASVEGGLSGPPLKPLSTRVIARVHARAAGRLPIIGVGGIRSAADLREKTGAGATLVQLYTGLVYEGPGVVGRIVRSLATE